MCVCEGVGTLLTVTVLTSKYSSDLVCVCVFVRGCVCVCVESDRGND